MQGLVIVSLCGPVYNLRNSKINAAKINLGCGLAIIQRVQVQL